MQRGGAGPRVAERVLRELQRRAGAGAGEGALSDADLLLLHSVFGSILERALDILEKHPTLITYRTKDNQRTLIEVKGDADRCYRLYPGINYCPCQAFKHQVCEKRSQLTCKHVLAARIASMTNRLVYQEITQPVYLMLVQSMYDFESD